MKIFYFITSILLCLKAYSFNDVLFSKIEDGEKYFSVLYLENNMVFLSHYKENRGDYQDYLGTEVNPDVDSITKILDQGFEIRSLRDSEIIDYNQESFQEIKDKSIWKAENSWSKEWERKYSDWVKNEITPEFFYNYKIPSDCADVIVGLRWIFARIHKLPSAHHLAGSGRIFSNYSLKSSWTNLPRAKDWYNDKLFLRSLRYLMNNTYTGSLRTDTYPIRINNEYLMPGTMHLSTKYGRHVTMFKSIDLEKEKALNIIESTLPPKVRKLYSRPFLFAQVEPYGKGGILNLRWPIVSGGSLKLLAGTSMPGFSKEQFENEFINKAFKLFNLSVMKSLDDSIVDKEFIELMSKGLQGELKKRDRTVLEGHAFCKKNNCSPGTQNYFFWSTPSRDKKIRKVIEAIETIRDEGQGDLQQTWISLRRKTMKLESLNNSFQIGKMIDSLKSKRASSDPRHSLKKRWGF